MGIRELNVGNWDAHNALNTFNHAVPAIKTSAGKRKGKPLFLSLFCFTFVFLRL